MQLMSHHSFCFGRLFLSFFFVIPSHPIPQHRTDTLTAGVTEFCGTDIPIIFMADTNVGMGYVATGSLFLEEPLRSLANDATENAYTCCNDTSYGGVLNAFASDRIAVTSTALTMDRLEGGSVAPNGPLPFGMRYQCAATEEHLPLRAHISFQN